MDWRADLPFRGGHDGLEPPRADTQVLHQGQEKAHMLWQTRNCFLESSFLEVGNVNKKLS